MKDKPLEFISTFLQRFVILPKKGAAKEIIINAAWELFQEKGYEETTLKDIIERSGTSRGAFYHNFRSKEDVLFMQSLLSSGCESCRSRESLYPAKCIFLSEARRLTASQKIRM